jgi:hypothetical protein
MEGDKKKEEQFVKIKTGEIRIVEQAPDTHSDHGFFNTAEVKAGACDPGLFPGC